MGGGIYTNGSCHMTKMGTVPIYGTKPLKIFFSRPYRPMILKLAMKHYVLRLYKFYINDDPELTLTYSTTMSNMEKLVYVPILGPGISFIGPLVINCYHLQGGSNIIYTIQILQDLKTSINVCMNHLLVD